jgi:hypothetical protein
MAWYALCPHDCPSVVICDPHYAAGASFGHSKGYALRKHALAAAPRGFSALMLRQTACARSGPRPFGRRGGGHPRPFKRTRFTLPGAAAGESDSEEDDMT